MDGNGICLFGGFFMFTLSNLYIFNVVFGHQEHHVIFVSSLTLIFLFSGMI